MTSFKRWCFALNEWLPDLCLDWLSPLSFKWIDVRQPLPHSFPLNFLSALLGCLGVIWCDRPRCLRYGLRNQPWRPDDGAEGTSCRQRAAEPAAKTAPKDSRPIRTLHFSVAPRNRKAASKTRTRTGNLQSWGPKNLQCPMLTHVQLQKVHRPFTSKTMLYHGLPLVYRFFFHVKLAGSCGCSLWQYSEHGVGPPRKRTTTFDQSPFWMFIPQNLVFIGWQRDAYPQGAGQSPHFLPQRYLSQPPHVHLLTSERMLQMPLFAGLSEAAWEAGDINMW